MAKKLYVGNLPYSYTADSLKTFFGEIGNVLDATVITDKVTGRSRGFGFVEMDDADADKAVEQFNGKDVDGRKITVNEARPKTERESRGPRRSY